MRKCHHCNIGITLAREGARYCSGRCRVAAHRAKKPLPAPMTNACRWIRRDARKKPLTIRGFAASVNNPDDWTDYETASASPIGKGLGFVLGAGIGCIDLDHCIVGGDFLPWAADVITEHKPNALLIERSVSGDGVHIFLPMKPGRGQVIRDHRNIEIYPPDSGRYIAVTGDRL